MLLIPSALIFLALFAFGGAGALGGGVGEDGTGSPSSVRLSDCCSDLLRKIFFRFRYLSIIVSSSNFHRYKDVYSDVPSKSTDSSPYFMVLRVHIAHSFRNAACKKCMYA